MREAVKRRRGGKEEKELGEAKEEKRTDAPAMRRDPVTGQPFAPPTLQECKELAQNSECNAGVSSLSSSLEVGEWPSKAALGDSLAETSEHLRALLRSFRETFAPRTDCANPAVE